MPVIALALKIAIIGEVYYFPAGDLSKDNYRLVELGQRSLMYSKGTRDVIFNQDYTEFGYGISTNISTRKTFIVQTFR